MLDLISRFGTIVCRTLDTGVVDLVFTHGRAARHSRGEQRRGGDAFYARQTGDRGEDGRRSPPTSRRARLLAHHRARPLDARAGARMLPLGVLRLSDVNVPATRLLVLSRLHHDSPSPLHATKSA
jgi:hypothetical protein